MTKERRLKLEALECCNFRGHTMSRFGKVKENQFLSFCMNIDCQSYVVVNLNILPNDIDIGGRAVALHCPVNEFNI